MARLDRSAAVTRETLGHSHGGRPIEALRIGQPTAPRLVILLGRQHPPEVSGAIAMEHFLETLVTLADAGKFDAQDLQVLAVPLLNPDGVARGHWRANLGGEDLNRDWGTFAQPETRSVAQWLGRLPSQVRPVAMVDFHSTSRNLFYVQGDESSEDQERFLARWLGGKEHLIADYPFSIERRNSNPGAGTAKNWFHTTHAIPAYTYEVGDETDRQAVAQAARELAKSLVEALSLSELP
ncbi:M14 family metallopeptidase [Sphingopyxis sp.]|uniref:M14 family metallopeptidase n=1 Tax=Sphingopyxis sp. TaxID=1908224 RepID=UPI0025F200A7|nr:M14 family metallopeptidase [Sphingopyxis sp.]MBK6414127.1 succinylglutamate desuccinylase/aspartoacylase family protein [Sphingopyxis sp.]